MATGCASTGGMLVWGTSMTVMVNARTRLKPPLVSAKRTLALAVPASENPGARWMLPVAPVPGVGVVTLMYAGPDTFSSVSTSLSGSVLVRAWSAVAPSFTVMLLTVPSVGGRLTLFTVIWNVLSSKRLPSLARTVADLVPASLKPGSNRTVEGREMLMYTGPASTVYKSGSVSGSVAVRTCSAVAPSFTVMLAGCVSTGARLTFWIVSTVVLLLVSVPSAANQVMVLAP